MKSGNLCDIFNNRQLSLQKITQMKIRSIDKYKKVDFKGYRQRSQTHQDGRRSLKVRTTSQKSCID